jgi:hypothetical protein
MTQDGDQSLLYCRLPRHLVTSRGRSCRTCIYYSPHGCECSEALLYQIVYGSVKYSMLKKCHRGLWAKGKNVSSPNAQSQVYILYEDQTSSISSMRIMHFHGSYNLMLSKIP